MAESVKNRTVRKDDFFEAVNLLKSENSKLMKVAYISEDHAQKIPGHFDFSVNSYELNGGQQKTVSAQESKFSMNFQLEAYLDTTMQ